MMSRKNMKELVGMPVKLMRNKEPMVPFLAAKGSRISVRNMAPIRNKDASFLSIMIDGNTMDDKHFEFEVIIETVYTRKQIFNLLKGADAMYVLGMKVHIVDACGNCRMIPHIKVRSFSRLHQNEEMTRIVNGVEFH